MSGKRELLACVAAGLCAGLLGPDVQQSGMSDESTVPEKPSFRQKPTVGRVVHFHRTGLPAENQQPLAALIAAIHDPAAAAVHDAGSEDSQECTLFVLDPIRGALFETALRAPKDQPAPGRWNFPPYAAPTIIAHVIPSGERPTEPPPAPSEPVPDGFKPEGL